MADWVRHESIHLPHAQHDLLPRRHFFHPAFDLDLVVPEW
jgi:hypothetical protein